MKQVKLKSSFAEILGKKREEYSDSERKMRWEEWKRLAKENGDNDMVEYWSDTTECIGCVHLRGTWCDLQSLPCSVNPVLTVKLGMVGMACMGLGYESNN